MDAIRARSVNQAKEVYKLGRERSKKPPNITTVLDTANAPTPTLAHTSQVTMPA